MNAVRLKYLEGNKSQKIETKGTPADSEISRLVERVINGDLEAFGELYGIYRDRIYRYVFYQVRDRMTAEDLTEEIFMKAWGSMGKQKKQVRTFSSWLYRVAHNHVIDYFRTRRQHESLDETIPDASAGPLEEVEEKLMQQQLAESLSCLLPQQRQTIILKFIEELDNREIARIMQKRPGAVRVMQMRALEKLRQKLGSEGNICGRQYTKHSATV